MKSLSFASPGFASSEDAASYWPASHRPFSHLPASCMIRCSRNCFQAKLDGLIRRIRFSFRRRAKEVIDFFSALACCSMQIIVWNANEDGRLPFLASPSFRLLTSSYVLNQVVACGFCKCKSPADLGKLRLARNYQ